MGKITKVVFAIIAGLIGAGFASGQEINTFFYAYGAKGIVGLAICSILLMYIIDKTLKIIELNGIDNYYDFVNEIIGKKSEVFIINLIVNLFLMVTFFIMLAGFGAYFSQELQINSYIGSSILAIACFITFLTDVGGVVKVSNILVPILIFFIILIGVKNISTINVGSALGGMGAVKNGSWLISSVLYCSYNSILLIPMLLPLRRFILKNKHVAIIAITSGIIIFILAISIFILLTRCKVDLNTLEMPALYVVGKYFAEFRTIYAFIILVSIYTTAISIGVSFLENVSKNKKSFVFIALFICCMGVVVSGFGFSNLVAVIYPVFGYLGLIQIGGLVRKKEEICH